MAVAGCSGKPEGFPDLGQVEGTVTVDGQFVAHLAVAFVPEEGRPSLGITDDQGRYQLDYFRGESGAVIGRHSVMITTDLEEQPPPGYIDPIPPQYNLRTVLTSDVQAGTNVLDFDLLTNSN